MSLILHFGTFDVSNYGDLLFPLLARRELGSLAQQCELLPVSPAGGFPVGFAEGETSANLRDALARPEGIAGALIGGGNIIHCSASGLQAYRDARVGALGYGNLWLGPSFLLPPGAPLLWNAPGVPGGFRKEQHGLVRAALQRADYLSVRDAASRDFLLEVWPQAQVAVVPDSAWTLPRLWPREALAAVREAFHARRGGEAADRTVIFHLNKRYVQDRPLANVARLLDELAGTAGLRPVLVAFAPCHGDDQLAREVGALMATQPIVVDAPQSIQEIAALVAFADLYVGSSMHGLITALAYGVPAFCVSSRSMAKFDGLLKLVGQDDLVLEDWAEAKGRLHAGDLQARTARVDAVRGEIAGRLDAHWDRIREGLRTACAAPVRRDVDVTGFLRYQEETADILLDLARSDAAGKLAHQERMLREQGKHLQDLAAEVRRAAAELAKIRGSLSWRVGAPLRRASRRYPHAAKALVDAMKGARNAVRRIVRPGEVPPPPPAEVLPDVSAAIREYAAAKPPQGRRYVVYTAIFGGYDQLLAPDFVDPEVDYVCFTDRPRNDLGLWQLRPVPFWHQDPTRVARYVKTHPHQLLPEYEFAIWLDANIVLKTPARKYLDALRGAGASLALVPHPQRNCFYEEAQACVHRRKDDREVIERQVAHYRSEGLPRDTGLYETGFMIMRLADPQVRAMFADWWAQIERFSRRDQLGLAWAMNGRGLEVMELLPRGVSVREDEDFRYLPHDRSRKVALPEPVLAQGTVREPQDAQAFAAIRDAVLAAHADTPIDVIVCVYNALEDVRLCLESALAALLPAHRLIIVNDKSDEATSRFLVEFSGRDPRIRLVENAENLGYTKSANVGLRAGTAPFRIMLNSDTIVSPGWAVKMLHVAGCTPRTGVVGPLSNAAGAQSVPSIASSKTNTAINEIPPGVSLHEIDRALEQWSPARTFPLVPLVHGFCLGIKAEVLEKIGYFDEQNFARYYGEENDFCLRAGAAGFDLAIATNTFVFHRKSRSIEEEERIVHMAAAGKRLREMYGLEAIRAACVQVETHPLLERMRRRAQPLFAGETAASPEPAAEATAR